MPYDKTRDCFRSTPSDRTGPGRKVAKLAYGQISDASDLTIYAQSMRIYNGSAAAITLMVTPIDPGAGDLITDAIPITVPAGACQWEPIGARRIWTTASGSTGLTSGGAIATGVEVLLVLE